MKGKRPSPPALPTANNLRLVCGFSFQVFVLAMTMLLQQNLIQKVFLIYHWNLVAFPTPNSILKLILLNNLILNDSTSSG